MTPFMERVAEVVTGGERGSSPGTRPSEPRPVVIGADEQVMTRALAEQLVSEANAVLASIGPHGAAAGGAAAGGAAAGGAAAGGAAAGGGGDMGPAGAGDVIDLEDELGEGRLSFVMRYRERYARVSTSFERRTSVGHLDGVGATGAIALDGPEQLERLILLLLSEPAQAAKA
jgi:hypothetical protein